MEQLIDLAERYARAKSLSLSTVSQYAGGQGRLFERLKNGSEITFGRAQRLVQWFSDRWPEEAEWPEGLDRPEPSKSPEAA